MSDPCPVTPPLPILKFSPSQIESFDNSTRFGCQAIWWHKSAPGGPKIYTPPDPSQQLGTDVHRLNELHLLGRVEELAAARVALPRATLLYYLGLEKLAETECEGILGVEWKWSFEALGVKLAGIMDVRTTKGVKDWKTTGQIAKNAKTTDSLKKAHQMVLYGLASGLEVCELEHFYYQTARPYEVKSVRATMTRKELEDQFDLTVRPQIELMKLHAFDTDATKLTPDTTKCKRCPFKPQCPHSGSQTMSIREMLMKHAAAQGKALEPQPIEEVITAPQIPVPVLPPDAPSVVLSPPPPPPPTPQVKVELFKPPEISPALPVTRPSPPNRGKVGAAPAPTPLTPRKRGRPSKTDLPALQQTQQAAAEALVATRATRPSGLLQELAAMPAAPVDVAYRDVALAEDSEPNAFVRIKEVRYTEGLTLNLGDFNSARIDVGMVADVSLGQEEAGLAELVKKVKAQLVQQVDEYQAIKKGK